MRSLKRLPVQPPLEKKERFAAWTAKTGMMPMTAKELHLAESQRQIALYDRKDSEHQDMIVDNSSMLGIKRPHESPEFSLRN